MEQQFDGPNMAIATVMILQSEHEEGSNGCHRHIEHSDTL